LKIASRRRIIDRRAFHPGKTEEFLTRGIETP
jgi:hypothetical protein